jgi:hypothetical protein
MKCVEMPINNSYNQNGNMKHYHGNQRQSNNYIKKNYSNQNYQRNNNHYKNKSFNAHFHNTNHQQYFNQHGQYGNHGQQTKSLLNSDETATVNKQTNNLKSPNSSHSTQTPHANE